MRSILTTRHLLFAATVFALLAALVAGCAKQDLYEPPGSPYRIVGALRLPSAVEGVSIIGRSAFVAGGEAGLYSVDWSDPTAPRLLMVVTGRRFANDIEVARMLSDGVMLDIAYLLDSTEGTLIFDVTDPEAVTSVGSKDVAWGAHGIVIEQGDDPSAPFDFYMADDWKGIYGWSIDPQSPGELAALGYGIYTNGKAYGIAARDGWGYVADNEMGLCILDMDPFYSGSMTSWGDTPGRARAIALEGDYAFVADATEGLAVFRIDGGEAPVKLAQYDLNGFSVDIDVRDGLCAVAANGAGVHFLDVTNPAEPIYLGSTATSYATDVTLSPDGYCLVTDADDGLVILGGHSPFRDETPPSRVSNLVALPAGSAAIDLTWTMTGDDHMVGTATSLEIRRADEPIINDDIWTAATALPGLPSPEAPGTSMTYTVTGLTTGATYHFAMKVTDGVALTSALSNPAEASTAEGITLRNPSLSLDGGTVDDTYTYEVEAIWEGAFTATEVIIDGDAHTMTNVSGDLYRYETTLAAGEHDYSFHFAAADVAPGETEEIAGPVVGVVAFTMGSPNGEDGRNADEVLHAVALRHDLVAGSHEVTQSAWDAVMPAGSNPSQHPGADRPVDSVTWLEAVLYCNALSSDQALTPAYTIDSGLVSWDRDADGWRLPTEAEWEYLARAGTTSALYNGNLVELDCSLDVNLDAIGWYCGNAADGPRIVGQKIANGFDLYDTSGNVREWCWDWYGELGESAVLDPEGPATGFLRVCRGGSWYYSGQECRSAARGTFPPDSVDDTVGFRVVRTDFSR